MSRQGARTPSRRALLRAGASGALGLYGISGISGISSVGDTGHAPANPPALTARPLVFPRDAGAHPDYQTEWWYLTGYANTDAMAAAFGFQITFFRRRIGANQALHSPLAARQLLFAHAAVTDVRGRKLWHDQRIARWSGAEPGDNPLDAAAASTRDAALTLRDWSLVRTEAHWTARVQGSDFALDLRCTPSQPVLLQGAQGLSRKGPQAAQASYYYSLPQLQVSGDLVLQGATHRLASGSTAWMDHEWSQALLHPQAVGWDWIGINLFDGSALTAFRLRTQSGAALWDGGSLRSGKHLATFRPGDVVFTPLRHWRSLLSQAQYPVEWRVEVRTPDLAPLVYTVKAVLDDQELDSRRSTGAIYWEGLCEVWSGNGTLVGRGYLEMTGYAAPLRL